jgi:hypothetical protein
MLFMCTAAATCASSARSGTNGIELIMTPAGGGGAACDGGIAMRDAHQS